MGHRGGCGLQEVAPHISKDDANYTKEGRVMRLKGYGNSIVVPLAAEFIKAAMEVP
jgi:hypothetical protein